MNIDKHVNEAKLNWWQSSSRYNGFDKRYSKENDSELVKLKTTLVKYIETYDKDKPFDASEQQEVLLTCKSFMIQTMGVSEWAADQIFNEDYVACSQSFIERAKELVPDLERVGLFQALRNVWTMNSMQIYFGKSVKLTNAIFAYSMLYPLTDNYLDNPNTSKADKYEFNKRFLEKIKTGVAEHFTDEEQMIFHMIDLIEEDFDRSDYPDVYESLEAILEGQTLSIKQQGIESPYTVDLLGISIYKGGASVLADAYLVEGKLDYNQEKFAFNYGVLLQFADDLQDIKEDQENQHFTIFNIQTNKLDETICMYLNMMDHFFENVFMDTTNQQKALKEIMGLSLRLLIFTALLKNKKCISKSMHKEIVVSNTFSIRTLNKVERKFNNQLGKIMI
jgi:hypothetical protein